MSTITNLAERTGIDRSRVSELLGSLRAKGWVKARRPKAEEPLLWMLSEEGRKTLPPFTSDGYESIGGTEVQGLAISARDHYLSSGWFYAPARQDPGMTRKVDCVAYDYEGGFAVAVEIESSGHVLRDHVEQVKKHMLEISPFAQVHFWAHRSAAERILELRRELRSEDRLRVWVFAVGEGSFA